MTNCHPEPVEGWIPAFALMTAKDVQDSGDISPDIHALKHLEKEER
jgi:hypothetical protein